jgi:hypothetical protein
MLQGAKLKAEPYIRDEEEADFPGDNEDSRGSGSAKLEALVALLKQTPQSDKCLVFSSFVQCVSTQMVAVPLTVGQVPENCGIPIERGKHKMFFVFR